MTTTLDTPADVPGFIGLTCSLPGDGASMLTWLCTRTEPRAETLPLSEWLATASRTRLYSRRMAANRSSILPQ